MGRCAIGRCGRARRDAVAEAIAFLTQERATFRQLESFHLREPGFHGFLERPDMERLACPLPNIPDYVKQTVAICCK